MQWTIQWPSKMARQFSANVVKRQAFLEFGLSLSCGQMLLKIPVLRIMQESSLLPSICQHPSSCQVRPDCPMSLHLCIWVSKPLLSDKPVSNANIYCCVMPQNIFFTFRLLDLSSHTSDIHTIHTTSVWPLPWLSILSSTTKSILPLSLSLWRHITSRRRQKSISPSCTYCSPFSEKCTYFINSVVTSIFCGQGTMSTPADSGGPLPPGWDTKFDSRTGR